MTCWNSIPPKETKETSLYDIFLRHWVGSKIKSSIKSKHILPRRGFVVPFLYKEVTDARSMVFQKFVNYIVPSKEHYYYYWVDTTSGGLLIPDGIIYPVVSVSVLTWFIRYIYYWNLQSRHWQHFGCIGHWTKTKKSQNRKLTMWETWTPTKTRMWTKVLTKSKQFLLLMRHPPCYSFI